ncbi:hypothetical protein DL93DRAFT_2074027 [Clavulina sp. PMI_390]|nr:hypothetical protein DL93DRAFT_2074027 [Clavulina sp. PMI_390]
MAPYAYPQGNETLIKELSLLTHPEGGYFVETGRWNETVPGPFTGGEERPLGTTIYYLLSAENPSGKVHRNKSLTMHVLHQGRATYTLIHPPKAPGEHARVERITMGTNTAAGEVRQLLVHDAWKMSEIPAEDLALVEAGKVDKNDIGCLITEVVVPGFVWQDHAFLTQKEFETLFAEHPEGQKYITELSSHIRKE